MLKILVNDHLEGYDVHLEAAGTPEMIAEQLHSVMLKIAEKAPEVVELMSKFPEEGTKS